MRDHRKAVRLRLGECRVGRNQRDGGVLAHAALDADAQRFDRKRGGQAPSSKFAVLFEWRRPEMRGISDGHAPESVDGGNCADGRPIAHFSDGTTAAGDVLVAADGINSRLRAQYLPTATRRDTGAAGVGLKLPLNDTTRAWLPARPRRMQSTAWPRITRSSTSARP